MNFVFSVSRFAQFLFLGLLLHLKKSFWFCTIVPSIIHVIYVLIFMIFLAEKVISLFEVINQLGCCNLL